MFKRKQKSNQEVKETATPTVVTINEELNYLTSDACQPQSYQDNKAIVESAFADALDNFFIVDSKVVRGESLAVIRLEDFYNILCKHLNVDPNSTQYSSYAEPED